MEKLSVFRSFLVTFLFGLFCYLISESISKYFKKQKNLVFGKNQDGKLPSFTFCPFDQHVEESWKMTPGLSFEETEKLKKLKDYIKVLALNEDSNIYKENPWKTEETVRFGKDNCENPVFCVTYTPEQKVFGVSLFLTSLH